MEKHKLKNENEGLKYQISELNRKLDIVNQSLTKFIQLSQKQDQLILNLEDKYNSLKLILKDEIDKSIKYKHLIEFINLKKNLLSVSNLDEDDKIEMFLYQFIQNESNKKRLVKIFPSGVEFKNYNKYYSDLKDLYNRVVHNS